MLIIFSFQLYIAALNVPVDATTLPVQLAPLVIALVSPFNGSVMVTMTVGTIVMKMAAVSKSFIIKKSDEEGGVAPDSL